MNVLCGYFMVIAGREYPVYQLISTILSILIFFPARLLIRYFSPSRRASPMVLVAFLMFNPLVVQNSTYSWTKLLAVFYVLAGVSFYLRGWHQKEGRWTLAAFASLSCGLLAHYSAGPYTVFLAGHYLLFVFPSRKSKWIEISAISLVVLLILVGWFGYSFTTFGKGTVTSTTSYFEAASLTGGQNVAKSVRRRNSDYFAARAKHSAVASKKRMRTCSFTFSWPRSRPSFFSGCYCSGWL